MTSQMYFPASGNVTYASAQPTQNNGVSSTTQISLGSRPQQQMYQQPPQGGQTYYQSGPSQSYQMMQPQAQPKQAVYSMGNAGNSPQVYTIGGSQPFQQQPAVQHHQQQSSMQQYQQYPAMQQPSSQQYYQSSPNQSYVQASPAPPSQVMYQTSTPQAYTSGQSTTYIQPSQQRPQQMQPTGTGQVITIGGGPPSQGSQGSYVIQPQTATSVQSVQVQSTPTAQGYGASPQRPSSGQVIMLGQSQPVSAQPAYTQYSNSPSNIDRAYAGQSVPTMAPAVQPMGVAAGPANVYAAPQTAGNRSTVGIPQQGQAVQWPEAQAAQAPQQSRPYQQPQQVQPQSVAYTNAQPQSIGYTNAQPQSVAYTNTQPQSVGYTNAQPSQPARSATQQPVTPTQRQ